MTLIRLIVCTCGHCVDRHDADGCCGASSTRPCACRVPRSQVLDLLLDAEREEIRRQWLPDQAVASPPIGTRSPAAGTAQRDGR